MRRKIAPKDVQKAFAVFGMGLIAMFLLVVALMEQSRSFLRCLRRISLIFPRNSHHTGKPIPPNIISVIVTRLTPFYWYWGEGSL